MATTRTMPALVREAPSPQVQPVDRKYALGIWLLMVMGVVFVYSASFPTAGMPDAAGNPGNPNAVLYERLKHLLLALAAMIFTAYTAPQTIQRLSRSLFLLTVFLVALTFVPGLSGARNGATCWLAIPHLPTFQPSEFAKVAFIAFLALALTRKDQELDSPGRCYATIAGATAVMVVLLMLQSDQGMATVFVMIALSMAWFGGADWRWLAVITVGLAGGWLYFAWLEPYRWARITAMINPEGDVWGTSYHNIRMLIALARGGIAGLFLGLSPDKWGMLPEADTDSIFAVIGGEVGLVGCLGLMAGLGWLTWRGVEIARRSQSLYGSYLAAGCAVALGLQSLLHIMVNTSTAPCTGLTLPFISRGGTSLIASAIMAGMVLSVSRFARPEAEGK